MGFLRNLFSGREISRLEELIASSPAPSLFMRLAQLYLEMDEKEKAADITRRGAELFPESEALTNACADADKVKSDVEKQRLRARIEQYPSPMLYAKLAELYLKGSELQEAEKICRLGCRAYPDYGGLWSVLARIAELSGDVQTAYQHLERSTELDKYNYNALMHMVEISIRLGHRSKAKTALEKILFFAPDDVKATRWLSEFDARAFALEQEERVKLSAAVKAEKAVVAEKQRTAVIDGQALALAARNPQGKKSSGVGTSLHMEIREIRRVEGVRGTLLIDPYGLVIASDLPEGLDEELAGALVTNMCRTAESHAGELTLGEFEDAIIDAGDGRIHVLRVAQMVMAVFATPLTKAGLLQRAIHTFAEHVADEIN